MCTGTAFSDVNYDATLIAWEAQPHLPNVTVDFGTAQYSAGAPQAAYDALVLDGWVIISGGLKP
jgi:hypothetical protein